MGPKVQQKSKEQKAAAAMAGGKSKKKKWSKNKSRDKILNEVLFKEITYEKLLSEVPKMKLITTSSLVERLKINGSLARAAVRELEEKGLIRCVSRHSKQLIYTRATNTDA
mmetsp:Transcript_4151/g.6334  ORF Transcript_4151/g.6334 Transcript_4151/m.6334 type:complete len:111 (+) Transcript_4151:98-430(+)|eukprot:CAMPEP_0171463078 /NCGR_PEP_ID=MMETSP0945-20130129/6870_1 /TAXON_ID=109269 /ORGANISM="Vaucheria litorea, Strain CCMP2940" /LENGTH=110 /DNA_ID=CAMNT_0011989753 /DNA_START=98 /DNA_END=430 /DNA_ORIENTATION=+